MDTEKIAEPEKRSLTKVLLESIVVVFLALVFLFFIIKFLFF
jgi:hypothetical protein